MEKAVEYKKFRLQYFVTGSGPGAVITFPGFGRSHEDFRPFEAALSDTHTLYNFNWFFTGSSSYPRTRLFKQQIRSREFKEMFKSFLAENQIKEFDLIGYSIGGKVCLKLIELFPDKIKNVILLAPDGIRKNRWMSFVTNTSAGRSLFKSFIYFPYPFFGLISLLRKTGAIHERLKKFLVKESQTREQREKVLKVWLTMKLITPDIRAVKKIINDKKINLSILNGKYDRVILCEWARRFIKDIPAGKLYILYQGHSLLNDKTVDFVVKKKSELFR